MAAEALAGLLAPRKTLPPKLFYDEEGCRLFGEITGLPEYYVTRTERALLARTAPEIGRLRARARGAGGIRRERRGQGGGAARRACSEPAAYVPIDIAGAGAATRWPRGCAAAHPDLAVHADRRRFPAPARACRAASAGLPRLGFFPGSTIGNLEPARRSAASSRAARETLGAGALFLVGVDLRKDRGVLVPAYDDAAGVTAAFNLNLLARLNREAGADFDLARFAHRAVWNEAEGRIEMHLVSLQRADRARRRATHPLRRAARPSTPRTATSTRVDGFARARSRRGLGGGAVLDGPRPAVFAPAPAHRGGGMRARARTIALRRQREPSPWLPWLVLAALLMAAGGAFAQQPSAAPPSSPSANQPAPLPPPPGAKPDTPGGSSSNGVVRPPPVAGGGTVLRAPTADGKGVIAPPGTPGGNPNVVPK